MKMLVVFVLAVLGCSVTEGRLVSKCELRDQLKQAIANLTVKATPKGLNVDNLVAKIVCHSDLASGLNTSTVKELIGKEAATHSGDHTEDQKPKGDHNHRGEREARLSPQQQAEGPLSQSQPLSPAHPAQNCTLYGVFQLSSCLACNNSVTPSANICGTDCSKLLDDDTSDDVSCLLKIIFSVGIKPISDDTCEDVRAAEFFSGCRPS